MAMAQSALVRHAILARCSVLRRFDRDALLDVLGCDEDTVDSLLARPEVERLAQWFQLRVDLLASARERLLAEGPQVAVTIHQRAFLFYLRRLQHLPGIQGQLDDEDECLHHLA